MRVGPKTPSRLGSIALALIVSAGAVQAFHDGGVADCAGCHVSHNSADGQPVVPGAGNDYLLLADSASDVCLMCHAQAQGAVLGPNPLAPPAEKGGGNFTFLNENDINDAGSVLAIPSSGSTPTGSAGPGGGTGELDDNPVGGGGGYGPIPGYAAGHSVVAPGHGLFRDPRYSAAPGGTFPAADLGCTSCHDPHGRDTFRMLNGTGPVQGGVHTFSAPAPDADGLSLAPGEFERPTSHSAYRSGMSAWCGNCHGPYHDQGVSAFQHPIDEILPPDERTQYNQYDGVNNPTAGSPATAYLPEVPFEDASATTDSTAGPTAASRLTCVTCHRAHASSAPAAGRWDFDVSSLGADGIASGSWPIPNPYGDPAQPTLCWKCHVGGTD